MPSARNWTPGGPRADGRRADRLPTLIVGIDREPTRCSACGSPLLDRQVPLGPHARGLVTCVMCSEEVCWLAPPIAPRPVRGGSGVPAVTAVVEESVAVRVRRIVRVRFERLDGCGWACSAIYGHDPITHEQVGHRQALASRARARDDVIRTGPLAIDYGRRGVSLDGVDLGLSPREYGIVAFLGDRLGAACSREEIVAAIWGPAEVALNLSRGDKTRWHTLRITTLRTRAKLGDYGSMLETITGHGYRLRNEPPTSPEGA